MASKRRTKRMRNGERRFTVRGIRRDPPDIGKLSRALISLAMKEAELEAMAEQESGRTTPKADPADSRESGENHAG